MTDPAGVLEDRLLLDSGFSQSDEPRVLRTLGPLAKHLAGWNPNQVELRVSVKERGGKEQKITLEARLSGWPPFVATSTLDDLDSGLIEVRKELIRQVDDAKQRREPAKNRESARKPLERPEASS
jgi:hypothetical protein